MAYDPKKLDNQFASLYASALINFSAATIKIAYLDAQKKVSPEEYEKANKLHDLHAKNLDELFQSWQKIPNSTAGKVAPHAEEVADNQKYLSRIKLKSEQPPKPGLLSRIFNGLKSIAKAITSPFAKLFGKSESKLASVKNEANSSATDMKAPSNTESAYEARSNVTTPEVSSNTNRGDYDFQNSVLNENYRAFTPKSSSEFNQPITWGKDGQDTKHTAEISSDPEVSRTPRKPGR